MVYSTLAAYGVASPTQKHFDGSAKEPPPGIIEMSGEDHTADAGVQAELPSATAGAAH